MAFVRGIRSSVVNSFFIAGFDASRSGKTWEGRAHRVLTSLVVVAVLKSIGSAPIIFMVVMTCDNTRGFDPGPGSTGIPSAASRTTSVAARINIFSRKFVDGRAISLNANAISCSFSSAKSPARATVRLIADLFRRSRCCPIDRESRKP